MKERVALWLYGLVKVAIAGGATSITAGFAGQLADPKHFAMGGTDSLRLMGLTFITSALVNVFLYLQKSPLPPIDDTAE